MKQLNRSKLALGSLVALALGIGVWAQTQYPMARSDAQRTGLQNQLDESPGRMLLRWFDPTRQIETVFDNWEASAVGLPTAQWIEPAGDRLAANFTDKNPVPNRPKYVYAALTPSGLNDWQPQIPANLSTFSWTFNATVNAEYSLWVNIPSGPTNDAAGNLFYPQQYFVYQIDGVENVDNPGQPVYDTVDTFLTGGGEVRLGNGGRPTSRIFRATSTSVRIRLLNTIARDSQGDLTETRPNAVVYADSAKIVRGVGEAGSYTASPVTAEYDFDVAGQRRVFAARNEEILAQVGSEARSYKLGITSAFVHNGTKVDLSEPNVGGDIRRNVEWSWPVQRPTEDTEAARNTYSAAKVAYINASGFNRADQALPVDNRSVTSTATVGWTIDNVTATRFGTDFVTAPVVGGVSTESVSFRAPYTPEGQYRIQVWSPGPDTNYARAAKVEIRRAGFVIATVPVNFQSASFAGPNRWITLAANNVSEWDSSPAADLEVRITNASDEPTDSGKLVPADAVRFVRQSDLSVTATPAVGRFSVGGVQRNVLFIPMENGRIHALVTDVAAGAPTTPTLLWTYPRESLAGQEDTVGISQAPVGFGSSSPLFAVVNGQPRLYVGTLNGRVYCLNALTGDRIWSWPNDYPSAAPTTGQRNPIEGSVTLARFRQGVTQVDSIVVPMAGGRLVVLDADGNAADKTTSTLARWPQDTDPDPSTSPVRMTPVADGNNLFAGIGGELIKFDLTDNNGGILPILARQDGNNGVPASVTLPEFGAFGTASPVYVNATQAANAGIPSKTATQATIYVPAAGGVYALNASDLSVQWHSNESPSNLFGSLGFSITNAFSETGIRDYTPLSGLGPEITPGAGPGRPVILVPTSSGLARLYARTTDKVGGTTAADPIVNQRNAGRYEGPGTRTTSLAFVGTGQGMHGLAALGDALGQYDDDYGFVYFADDAGFLYAFGDDPDLPDNGQILTPGVVPISEEPSEPNNPAVADVRAIADNARVTLLIPAKFREIQRKIGSNQPLTAAELNPFIKNTSEDAAMIRTAFEYGETLYVLIYNLPQSGIQPGGQSTSYRMTASLTLPGSPAQARPVSLKTLTSSALAVGIAEIQLQPGGTNGMPPGRGVISVTVTPATTSGNVRGGGVAVPRTNFVFGQSTTVARNEVTLANPLALSMPFNLAVGTRTDVGFNTDPSNIDNTTNGSPIAFSSFSNYLGAVTDANRLGTSRPEEIGHGNTAFSRLLVTDRSLISLIRGATIGLSQVRFRAVDMVYPTLPAVIKPLSPADYRNFEQLPTAGSTNNSLDYPNLRRDSLIVRKSVTGAAQNPIFNGVSLNPPTRVDETTYDRDITAYQTGLTTRTLVPTEFRVEVDVPKFQPPAFNAGGFDPGYFGQMFVYVDPNSGVPATTFDASSGFAFRSYVQNTTVGVDEALSVATKTVDLGALPGGSIYVANLNPWQDNSIFGRTQFQTNSLEPFFKTFGVLNEGNVNLLNVRTAKGTQSNLGAVDPLRLFAGAVNGATAVNGQLHLHTDLDPILSQARPGGRRILQKARVGDSEPTRLRLTPVARANPNLGVADTGLLDLEDPRVAVSVPIGTPTGDYLNQIRVFEDTDVTSAQFPSIKRLNSGVDEPFSNPGFDLRFRVRESRLTTAPTVRTRPMVDTGASASGTFNWENVNPSMIRDASGSAYIAWSSNRRTAAQVFGFDPRPMAMGDTERELGSTIYIARINGDVPTSQANDVEFWNNTNANRWFSPAVTAYPDANLFPNRPGATYSATSVRFEHPVFATGGISDPFSFTAYTDTYMAFVGSAVRTEDNVREYRLFILPINLRNGNLTLNLADARPLAFGGEIVTSTGRIGRPALVTLPTRGTPSALVFYPESASGQTQAFWAAYDPNNGWVAAVTRQRRFGGDLGINVGSLGLTSSFESVSSISAAARTTVRNGRPDVALQVAFTGKLRGRVNSDTFLSTLALAVSRTGIYLPSNDPTTRTPVVPWETRTDPIDWDPASEMYWSFGAEILASDQIIYGNTATSLDLLAFRNGSLQTILVDAERQYNAAARIFTCRTIYGGTATVDLANGSVRFSDAVLPRGLRVQLRYTPRYVRVNSGNGNARGVSMVIDRRFQTETNYLASSGFQFNNSFGEVVGRSSPAEFYRMWVAYTKTASTSADASRIAYRTFRQGGALSQRVALDNQGRILRFQVNSGMVGGTWYQVDPVNGLIFVSPQNEGRTLQVSYTAVRQDGTTFTQTDNVAIGWAGEGGESTMPTDQGVNESGVFLAIDPLTAAFRRQDRPGLLWVTWVSTRQGRADVFMQTLAPRISPVPGN